MSLPSWGDQVIFDKIMNLSVLIVPKTGKRAAKSFCVKVSCLPRSAIVVSVVFHLFVLEVGSVSPLEKQCTC
jgi:hypothetical protein